MRILGIILLIILIVIQFFQPEKNQKPVVPEQQIQQLYPTPEHVQVLLQGACMDCHSNTTDYPWYMYIQPLGWWMADHIEEGKEHFNLDNFGLYDKKKQAHKMEELVEMVEKEAMPLKPYPTLHKEARLSESERQTLIDWAKTTQHSIENSTMN